MTTHALTKTTTNAAIVARKLQREMTEEIRKALPWHMSTDRFLRLAVTMLRRKDLQECSPLSLMSAVMEAAALGLELDGILGHGYIAPFKNEAVFIAGYRGLVHLMHRSGEVDDVTSHIVYENDEFYVQEGSEPKLVHVPCLDSTKRGQITHFYARLIRKSELVRWEIMSLQEVLQHRARSPAFQKGRGPWTHPKDWLWMARKTVIRQLAKTADISPEVTQQVIREEYLEAGIKPIENREGPRRWRFGAASSAEALPEPQAEGGDIEKTAPSVQADGGAAIPSQKEGLPNASAAPPEAKSGNPEWDNMDEEELEELFEGEQ